MLRFFFNRESKVVMAMEIIGLFFLSLIVIEWWSAVKTAGVKTALFLYILIYLIIRAFASLSWYDKNGLNRLFPPKLKIKAPAEGEKYQGIELQFKKAMVPTSYILAIFSGLLLGGAPGWILYIAVFLLIVIVHVNFILLYFHIKDKETLPINYFTHNKHLKTTE